MIFGDELTPFKMIGFVIATVGVGLYKYYKLKAIGLV